MGQTRMSLSSAILEALPTHGVQHLSLWRTCKRSPTVTLALLYESSYSLKCRPFVHTVNADELERLKKRFMKLDRCGCHALDVVALSLL